MADIITALHHKRQSFVQHKNQIKAEYDHKIAEVDLKIAHIDMALKTLNAAVQEYLCPHCKGTGTVRKADAAGQMEDWPCPKCKGTGVAERSEDNS